MSVVTLNNNQVATVVNAAIAQATGAADVGTLDLEGIIDAGNDSSVIGSREQFTKSLLNVLIKNWFTDSSYRGEYNNPFFEDSARFGALIQAISVDVPDVQASSCWQDFGTGQGQVSTVGTYSVYLPVVHTQYYGKTVSWELPITLTDEQWDTAFKNADELAQFVAYILLVVDNMLVAHMEDMDAENRNNFMAEKIAYAASFGAHGIHKINLVEKYAKETDPTTSITVNEYLNNVNCMRHGMEKIRLYMSYMHRMSTRYNTAGRKRFTPRDRMILQVLTFFDERCKTVALSDTYHDELVRMGNNYQSVGFWQGSGDDDTDDFTNVSTIDVKIASDGTAVKQSGIVALACDKWCILHTIKKKRTASKMFEPEGLQNLYYQTQDMYWNDLTLNGIVFTLEDYTAPTP